MTALLACRQICKRFGSIVANDGIDFDLVPGEIHALVGENGAGKSTLVGCIYGLHQPDSGQIEIDGSPEQICHPREALGLGIGLVQQHFVLVPPLTVTENIVLGTEPHRGVRFDRQAARKEIAELSERFGLSLDPGERVQNLSVAERQQVEIARALYRRARILMLDEPTAVLTPQESRQLLENLSQLREQGLAIVLITHRIPETMSVADRVTVLRRGRVVLHDRRENLTDSRLAQAIVGEYETLETTKNNQPGKVLVQLDHVCSEPGSRGVALRDISLDLRSGEIVGVAGVSGNGQQELVDALIGILPMTGGKYCVAGRDLTNATTNRIRQSDVEIACILQDRRTQGLLLSFSVTDNLFLGRTAPNEKWGIISQRERQTQACELIRRFEIAAPSPETPAAALSGGHQQRVIAARELSGDPCLIIAHDPTRGLDVRAASRVRNLLLEACDRGAAILLISSDLDEIMTVADRIAVLYEGGIRAILPADSATSEELGKAMAGV